MGLYVSVMALFLLTRSMSEVERWACLLEPRAWGEIPRKGTSPSARRSESRGLTVCASIVSVAQAWALHHGFVLIEDGRLYKQNIRMCMMQ